MYTIVRDPNGGSRMSALAHQRLAEQQLEACEAPCVTNVYFRIDVSANLKYFAYLWAPVTAESSEVTPERFGAIRRVRPLPLMRGNRSDGPPVSR